MRVREGDFAYDVEPMYDRTTLVRTGWWYGIFALRPEQKLAEGTADTREEAERQAIRKLGQIRERKQAA
ncbi:MAG TPA: hypothetical protein VG897_06475 [Terriglobales bacterium]|nr:hypothetical protein [Terriglobales bacterium]